MIKVYTGLKGLAMSLVFIVGVILFVSIFFWGITKVGELLRPLLTIGSYLLIIIFVFGIFPSTFFKEMRPSLSAYSILMSQALGVATWMLSFFFIIKAFGFFGIFFAFLFQFLAPLAIAGALLKGSWHVAGHLLLWIGFMYGMRFYSQWVLNLNPREHKKGNIIDVDAIAVGNDD